jgi:hypothetical protein
MEPTEGSETSAFKIQTPGKYPEEYLPHLQHGGSLKTMIFLSMFIKFSGNEYSLRRVCQSVGMELGSR